MQSVADALRERERERRQSKRGSECNALADALRERTRATVYTDYSNLGLPFLASLLRASTQ